MAYNSTLEVQFVELRKDIERYIGAEEYAYSKTLIEKAMTLCTKIYETTPSPEKKQIMRDNAVKLRQMYEVCKQRLGECDELTYDAPAAPTGNHFKPIMPKPAVPNPVGKAADADKSHDGDGIEYVIRGVDVRGFLCGDANEVVTFDDVIGMQAEKELIESEFFIDESDRDFHRQIGKKAKNFMLLYGVPGTGKTFFAKAVSEELKRHLGADIHFFPVFGPSLSDCKVGATEKNLQAVFEFCGQFERCVLFIDEFDALAPDRKKDTGDPTAISRVTTLLQHMDGFSSSLGTLLIAATNCPYNLDGAVLSRANVRIEVPLPNQQIIHSVLSRKIGDRLEPDVDLDSVAARLAALQYSNRDVQHFISKLRDLLDRVRRDHKKNGVLRGPEAYLYSNNMIESAFAEIHPSVKPDDLLRIRQFQQTGQ